MSEGDGVRREEFKLFLSCCVVNFSGGISEHTKFFKETSEFSFDNRCGLFNDLPGFLGVSSLGVAPFLVESQLRFDESREERRVESSFLYSSDRQRRKSSRFLGVEAAQLSLKG